MAKRYFEDDINLICPHCGSDITFSKSIAETILLTVCDHFGVSKADAIYNRDQSVYGRKYTKTRAVTIHFIRVFTGAMCKHIAEYMKVSPMVIGYYQGIAMKWFSATGSLNDEEEIKNKIILNLYKNKNLVLQKN